MPVPAMPDSLVSPMPAGDRAAGFRPLRFGPVVWIGAGVAGALVAGTVGLWAHYGSAVFFEMIMAGLAACF